MICESCRREVEYVRASFWHGEARICRECFAQWRDPDSDLFDSDAASVGNHVRLRHGLPPLAAALTILVLAGAPAAHASRDCLDSAEAARTWPMRTLAKDGDGCWTYDHHPQQRAEASGPATETIEPRGEPALMDRWNDTDLLQVELRELEPETISTPDPASRSEPFVSAVQLALFVSLVLATVSVFEVATLRRTGRARLSRWPAGKSR